MTTRRIGRLEYDRHTRISKWMTMVLRHRAPQMGLDMDSQGSVDIESMVTISPGFLTWEIRDVVANSQKGRFALNADETRVRAVSSHSAAVAVVMQGGRIASNVARRVDASSAENLPYVVFHGTFQSCMQSIWRDGLQRMGRETLHFSRTVSGTRSSSDVIIEIRVSDLLDRSFELLESENGVFLSYQDVPSKLFHRVLEYQSGRWIETWRAEWAR